MTGPYYADDQVTLWLGDALDVLREMPDESVDCIVTSPPYYGLRDYGIDGQYGLETSPAEYVETMRAVFAEAKRVLATDGTCWINIGDSYSGSWGNQGHKDDRDDLHVGVRGRGALPKGSRIGSRRPGESGPKNLYGIPWRLAFALQDDGWTLRNDIIWHKPNAMPESVADRLSGRYEHVFLLAKSPRYHFDLDAIRETTSQKSIERGRDWRERKAAGEPMKYGVAGLAGVGSSDLAPHPAGRNPGNFWEIDEEPFEFPRSMLTDNEAAYIASFIDGEGSICIRRRTRQVQLMLTVVNTHEGVIRWLHERTGMGQVRLREVRNENWRQVWEWCVTSRQAAQVIWAVYPHFRVKAQQAALALRFMELTRQAGSGSASAEYHELRHAMAEDLSALNSGRISDSKFAVEPVSPRVSSAGAVDVWPLSTQPYADAHFAVMPQALAERCIKAGCRPGGTVMDPFSGSGTTGVAARRLGRRYVGIDLSEDYHRLAMKRFQQTVLDVPQQQGPASEPAGESRHDLAVKRFAQGVLGLFEPDAA